MFKYDVSIRQLLRSSRSEMVPLRDELDFTLKYPDLEHAHFQERLEINVEVGEELRDELIPPMIL